MKQCNQCCDLKLLDNFYKQKQNKDGRQGTCKTCMNERVRQWYKRHPEKGREKSKNKVKSLAWKKRNSENTKNRKRPYLKYRESACRRCGFIPENMCQLTIDHIDQNRKNNELSNLQTLCHNCHNLKSYVERFESENLINMNLVPYK